MGKTSLALNIAENVALHRGEPVAIFSLEMSKESLLQRLLSSQARVDSHKFRTGHLGREDWRRMTEGLARLSEAPLWIDDSGSATVVEMGAKARRLKRDKKLSMVIVDYLQLIAARGDELEVIHDDHGQLFVPLETAGLGAHLHDGGRAAVVNPQRSFGQARKRVGHAPPVFAAQVAGAKLVGVNARLRGKQALEERFLGHFQAEDGHGLPEMQGHIFGNVQSQRSFSHGRTRGENDQLGRLQAGGQIVQLRVAGGDAGDTFAFGEDFFEALEAVADQVFDANQSGAGAVFRELKNRRFSPVKNGVGVFFGVERALLDLVRGVNEVPQDGFFFDDPRVVFDVGDVRHAVEKLREIGSAAGGFELAVAMQLFGEGHQVNGLLALVQRDHLLKDAPVMVVEEIFGTQLFDGRVNGVVVHQDGAEDAAFGVKILRQRAFENRLRSHSSVFALVSPKWSRGSTGFFAPLRMPTWD